MLKIETANPASKNLRSMFREYIFYLLKSKNSFSVSKKADSHETASIIYFSMYSRPNVPGPQFTDIAGEACLK